MHLESPIVKSSRLLHKKPLMYLNYTNTQKLQAYDYLMGISTRPKINPVFDEQILKILSEYPQSVSRILKAAEDHPSSLTARRLREIALIKAYKQMHESGSTQPFMSAVESIYGKIDKDLFWSILQETLDNARQSAGNKTELREVEKLINLKNAPKHPNSNFIHIEAESFREAQKLFKKLYSEEVSKLRQTVSAKPVVHRYRHEELIKIFDVLLKYYGLDKQGWSVECSDRTERVMVKQESKKISVSRGSFRLSRARVIGWALHEVAVHVNVRKNIGFHAKALGERRVVEEGLGVFVEQMLFKRFQPVRSLRYIALGLALGVDGKPRSAKEVHEIIWRLRYLGGVTKTKKTSKEYAAKEVIRVFRGVPLNQKGVVITKDRAYIEGNQLIWKHIQQHGPEFIFEKLLGKKL
jgi:hypothetical protein